MDTHLADPGFDPAPPVEMGMAKVAAIGTGIGLVGLFAFTFAIATLAGFNPAGAAGVAGFAAFWGGPGFGGIMAAIMHVSRHDKAEADRVAAWWAAHPDET